MDGKNAIYKLANFLFSLLIFSLISTTTFATTNKNKTITILFSDEHNCFTRTVEREIKVKNPNVQLISLSVNNPTIENTTAIDKSSMIVTIGYNSFEYLLKNKIKKPTLSCMIFKSNYDYLLNKYQAKNSKVNTAIFLDHSTKQHLQLIKSIYLKAKIKPKVGIILGNNTKHLYKEIENQAAMLNIDVTIMPLLSDKDKPVHVLRHILYDSNIILALSDSQVFNQYTARGLLLTASRHNVPIFGYSKAFTNVGALASIYTTKKQHAIETAENIKKILKDYNNLPLPNYSQNYTIAINYQAAKSFGIKINNTREIATLMEKLNKGYHG